MSACDIPDVISFLMRDFSFQARHRLLRVFQLCCLVTDRPRSIHPVVTLDLSGCSMDPKVFHDFLLLVQSYVLCPGYPLHSFFTVTTLDTVRGAIAEAGQVFVTPGFNLWSRFCAPSYDEFVQGHKDLYVDFIAEGRRSGEFFYTESNKTNRLIQLGESSGGGGAGSSVSEQWFEKESGRWAERSSEAEETTSSSVKRRSQASSQSGSKRSASSKSEKKKTVKKVDPDVLQRLK